MNSTRQSRSQSGSRRAPSRLGEVRRERPVLPPMTSEPQQKRTRPKTVTTIKHISKSVPIEVVPSEIIINDIQPFQTYEVMVLVRNLTATGRRIRIFQPKTNKFRCDYDMSGNIAPGLCMKLLVTFETDKPGDFHDAIEIVSEDRFSQIIPLHAYSPQSSITFDPFINFGFIRVQKEETRTVTFRNDGAREGNVDLKFTTPGPMTVSPAHFSIQPGSTVDVKLTYKPKEAGIFRDTLQVNVEGQTLLKHIDVSATSVDFYIFLIDEQGAQNHNYDFGSVYFGQLKEIKAYLVNNTPQKLPFKIKFLSGKQTADEEIPNLQTPNELGIEQLERVMNCYPSEGFVDSYSQIPLRFTCKSRVTDNMVFWTRNYCMKGDNTHDEIPESQFDPITYSYTAIFEFNGQTDLSPYVHISAKGICPTVKISSHALTFGECKVNEKKDIAVILDNKNEDHPVEFSFSSVANFKAAPKRGTLLPRDTHPVDFVFEPKGLGKFTSYMDLELFGAYKIPIKLVGAALSIGEKKGGMRGIENLPEDVVRVRRYVGAGADENSEIGIRVIRRGDRTLLTNEASQNINLPQIEATGGSEKMDLYFAQKNNRTTYNNFLKEQRHKRQLSRQKRDISEKVDTAPENLERYLPNKNFWLERDKEDKKLHHPFDFAFLAGTEQPKLDEPKYNLPSARDPLYVTKPLGPYEPEILQNFEGFRPDPNKPHKKIFPSEIKSQSELRDTSKDLTPDELQRVFAGPSVIDLGPIYVKSRVKKYFSIQNQLRTSILAQIEISHDELIESNTKPQIVPPSQTAGFEIVFKSGSTQDFKGYVKYIINNKHEFRFTLLARVEPVQLTLESSTLALKFQEKDEDMDLTNYIQLYNKGNSAGLFNFKPSQTGIFKINPMQGEVPAQGSISIAVTYVPSGTNFKGESERLTMNVQDGETQYLTCTGFCNESKCDFKEKQLDFEQILVSDEKTKSVYLRNKHKTTAVFQVNWKLPPGVTITPTRGRIPPDSHTELKVNFRLNEPIVMSGDILVSIRGGKQAKLAVKGETVVPQVKILEDEFDFGPVTFGSSSQMKLTFVNESNIGAVLDLDLTEGDAEYLEIVPAHEHGDDESSFFESFDDGANLNEMDAKDMSAATEESDEEEEEEKPRKYTIKVKKLATVEFILTFKPEDAKNYTFELPIALRGYGKTDGTSRLVSCRGIKPKCIIQPNLVDFKKKVINNMERSVPVEADIEVDNMDHHKPLIWHIDPTVLAEDNIFMVIPHKGRIEPGQRQIIRVGFNPLDPGTYEKHVPFYIDNDHTKPYTNLILKGFGDYPNLFFERKEVILPVVPLDIESRCQFKIINDGYENLQLKYEIINDVGTLPLKLEFPEGKTLGVTKPKLKVDVVFKSAKPLSITTEVQFIDNNKKIYRIRLSATADNCLLTNFPYLQKSPGEYYITAEPGKPIRLREVDEDGEEGGSEEATSHRAYSVGISKTGSIARTARSLLGYAPIPYRELERACENIKAWLNQNVLTTYINRFPHDVIENNGGQLFELLNFLTGKMPPNKANIKDVTKKLEKVQVLHQQYDEMIRTLKENGALLNTIRPEYLLKSYDYNLYAKVNAGPSLIPSMIKLSENKFNYLSLDSWITLFYQIVKIYHLNRLTPKVFKNTPGMPVPEKQNTGMGETPMEGSNLLSVSENLLLRWLETHYNKMKPGSPRVLKSFDEDLKDGHVFAAVIQSYVGINASKALQQLRVGPQNKEEYLFNAEKVIRALGDIGLTTQLTARDIESPRQREMVLFTLYLYNNLPHYIPKETVEFRCILREEVVKHIILNNPSSRPINYRVRLEGESDFSLETGEKDASVRVEPKSMVEFPVKFSARISKPLTARIYFTNKKDESNTQAAALVFDLISKVTGRKSEVTEVFESKLYELKNRDIKIENIFGAKADFQIELIHQKPPADEKSNLKKNRKRSQSRGKFESNPEAPEQEKIDLTFEPFSCRLTTLTVGRGATVSLPISFLPFTMDEHICYIVFRDDRVGEMQYTLKGNVNLPPVIEVPAPSTFYLENEMNFNVSIQVNNPHLINARRIHLERLPPALKLRDHEREKAIKQWEKSQESLTFIIESQTQYVSTPPNIVIPNAQKKATVENSSHQLEKRNTAWSGLGLGHGTGIGTGTGAATTRKKGDENSLGSRGFADIVAGMIQNKSQDANTSVSSGQNKLPITVLFKAPTKEHPLRFVARNTNGADIRLYEFKITVLPKPIKAVLEMRCPAREFITQDIPLKNESDREWTIKASLAYEKYEKGQAASQCFLWQKELKVPKGQVGNYQVTFKPEWIMQVDARLTLNNTFTGQQLDFDLKGYGEEPLAEGHVVLECKARKTKTHVFHIKNETDKKVSYRVETDLYNASGKSTFELFPNRTEEYVLEVTPVLGGAYTGSITFYDQDNRYKWWTVEVHTESPKAEKVIDLVTTVRKAVAFEIAISNPLDERVIFEVAPTGEGLLGENSFTLLPKQTATYELVFSPLKAGKQVGSIAFIHEKLGEVWYDLNLEAQPALPVKIPAMKAELGKVETCEIELENPSNQEVQVRYRSSNPYNFEVLPENIVIPPYNTTVVTVRYIPSDLDMFDSCEILFETDEISNWTYQFFGQGIAPTQFEPKVIAGGLNRETSTTINFKNPFKDTIFVHIYLEGNEDKAFSILLKKNRVAINGQSFTSIPVSFCPKNINDYQATLVVAMNEKIKFRYPLTGVTESYTSSSDFYLKTKCRVKLDKELKIYVSGNPNVDPKETYSIELANVPPEYEKIIHNPHHKSINFIPIRNSLSDPSDPLIFKAIFNPLKPFKAVVELIVIKSSGGRWKYKLHMEAGFPDPDDTITITSAIHKSSSVSFKLNNYTKVAADFTAGFNPESDVEFTVTPKFGILEKAKDSDSTTFVVTFAPLEYGKLKTGKLIIQSDEMLWSFNIKGTFPKYVIPRIETAKIQNRLSTEVIKRMGQRSHRNFLVENIRKSSHSPMRVPDKDRSRSNSRPRSPPETARGYEEQHVFERRRLKVNPSLPSLHKYSNQQF